MAMVAQNLWSVIFIYIFWDDISAGGQLVSEGIMSSEVCASVKIWYLTQLVYKIPRL